MKKSHGKMRLFAPAGVLPFLKTVLCLFLFVSSARAEEDDLLALELYNGSTPEIVSAHRSPRPASQTAENITVVTASEIEALNAHTLADVLFTVTGIQFQILRTPGSISSMAIQGAAFKHILVLIDNVPINNLSDNFPDTSSVPVQMIERIEIVKGAASSSWGSALGGVVNIITKTPQVERPFGGLGSVSFGKRETADGRAELSGTLSRFGYYLTGGKLRSDGLLPNNTVDLNSFYGKLHYDLSANGILTLTTGFTHGSSGQTSFASINYNQDVKQLISTLSAHYPLTDSLSMEASVRTNRMTAEVSGRSMANGSLLRKSASEDASSGASLKAYWLDDLQRVVAGVDYDHLKVRLNNPQLMAGDPVRSADRVGVYLNDTFTLGAFAVTPSARFDHTDTGGDLFSPSFGITYALTENSVLRGYTARGYSVTSIVRPDSTEKVWTSQVGFESADIPYLWLKGTLFRNETWDVKERVENVSLKQRQLKQGYELEARTLPFLGTSLSLGYTFIDARDASSRTILKTVPRHMLDLGIKYEDSRFLRALLTGHYIDWNADDPRVRYDDMVWDLYLGKRFRYADNGSVELFVSVRNLFNSSQYVIEAYKNAKRWGEMGVRCEF